MRYWVNGQCHGGGWSMTLEAASPQEALAKALDNEPQTQQVAYEVKVYPELPQMPQDSAYVGQMMAMPQPFLTVTRGPQPIPPWLYAALMDGI